MLMSVVFLMVAATTSVLTPMEVIGVLAGMVTCLEATQVLVKTLMSV